tara:strand:- start:30 stop:347 length:318 start_codon:yes stop_codon:yes gene_type:complete
MKLLKFFLILSLYILVSSCGTVKEAFTNQKKNSSDEFLVEKKSPLVMPPDYNDLPVPNTDKNVEENSNNIESLITNNEKGDKKDNNSEGSDQNLEKTLLNKIKKN